MRATLDGRMRSPSWRWGLKAELDPFFIYLLRFNHVTPLAIASQVCGNLNSPNVSCCRVNRPVGSSPDDAASSGVAESGVDVHSRIEKR